MAGSKQKNTLTVVDGKRAAQKISGSGVYTICNQNTGQILEFKPNEKFSAPAKTVDNFCRILEQDQEIAGTICYNEVAYRRWVRGQVPWESEPVDRAWTNSDESWLTRWIENVYNIKSKDDMTHALRCAESLKKINPIREFLDGLKWDGKSRISTIQTEYLGVEPTPYNVESFKVWLFGAVARAYHPGTKFDYMIVYTGRQGIGKSTFLSRLAINAEWFNDGLKTLDCPPNKIVEQLSGRWILEMGELAAMKRTQDVESIKQFLTAQFDVHRVPYEKYEDQRPRACVFAGTTNSLSFLADTSGGRRFLPIEVGIVPATKSLFNKACMEDFEQLWAEIVLMYKAGEYSLRLSDDMEIEAESHRDLFQEEDVRVGLIQEFCDNTPEDIICVPMIYEKALGEFSKPTRRISNEIHDIMRRNITGWRLHPNKGGKARCGKYGPQVCYVRDIYILEETIKNKLQKEELL